MPVTRRRAAAAVTAVLVEEERAAAIDISSDSDAGSESGSEEDDEESTSDEDYYIDISDSDGEEGGGAGSEEESESESEAEREREPEQSGVDRGEASCRKIADLLRGNHLDPLLAACACAHHHLCSHATRTNWLSEERRCGPGGCLIDSIQDWRLCVEGEPSLRHGDRLAGGRDDGESGGFARWRLLLRGESA